MVEFNGKVSGANSVGANQGGPKSQDSISAEVAKKILIDFKQKDTDTSMRVSFDELSNAIIKEYVANGYKRTDAHTPGETITDLLNYYQERAKEFDANGDGALNIDEYTAMFREKFEQAEKELAAQKSNGKVSDITPSAQSENSYESSAVRFEKTYSTGQKSAQIVDNFVNDNKS